MRDCRIGRPPCGREATRKIDVGPEVTAAAVPRAVLRLCKAHADHLVRCGARDVTPVQ